MIPARSTLLIGLTMAAALAAATPALAGRFMTLVEAETFAPGEGEIIQAGSLTLVQEGPTRTETGSWQLGVEFGLVPNLQVGLALPAWTVVRDEAGTVSRLDGVAMWGVWNLAAPAAGRPGVAAVAAIGECAEEVSGEVGLVVESSRGPWAVVANASLLHCRPHDPRDESGNHLLGRLGVSRNLGHGFALAVEAEWLADHFGAFGYRAESFNWGPAVLWEGAGAWVLAGALLDPDPLTVQRGAALQVQAGLPF